MKPSRFGGRRGLMTVVDDPGQKGPHGEYFSPQDQFYEQNSDQGAMAPKKFKLGPLGNLNQVITALGKTIRAMADGSLDSQVGARICNGLGIMRSCLKTATLDRLGERLDQLESRRETNYVPKHDQSHHVAH